MEPNKLLLSGCLILNKNNELLLLYRKDHGFYETPGGKVEHSECFDFENPKVEELKKTAERELFEELGNNIKISGLEFFGSIEFKIPNGRLAVANKFVTKLISGIPIINEPNNFSKLDYLSVSSLETFPLSSDMKLLLPDLKKRLPNFFQ